MFTLENVIMDIKDLVTKLGAVEGIKASEIKFKDAGQLELFTEAKIQIAKDLANKKDNM